ncbi:MAG: hypothetical protein ACRD1V_02045 [Vicinamibacterales bacterium]
MSSDATPWKVGDPSPVSGGPMMKLRRPTDAEKRALARRDGAGPATLGAFVDSASDDQHAELGDLYVDPLTGYQARAKAEAESKPAQQPATLS